MNKAWCWRGGPIEPGDIVHINKESVALQYYAKEITARTLFLVVGFDQHGLVVVTACGRYIACRDLVRL